LLWLTALIAMGLGWHYRSANLTFSSQVFHRCYN